MDLLSSPWLSVLRVYAYAIISLNTYNCICQLFLYKFKIKIINTYLCFSSVQSLRCVWLLATPWIAARHASLSITNSWSSLKLMSIELVMPFSHLILCHPLLLLPPIPPSIRVFPNESTLCMRWPKYWSFSFSIKYVYGFTFNIMKYIVYSIDHIFI